MLVEGKTVPVPLTEEGLKTFMEWFSDISNRKLASYEFENVKVSTVFLGLDHNWSGGGLPILWETVIFGGSNDGYLDRTTSKEEAMAAHKKAIEMVKRGFLHTGLGKRKIIYESQS